VIALLGNGVAISGQSFLSTVGTLLRFSDDTITSGAQAATLSLAPLSLGNQITAATLQTHSPAIPSAPAIKRTPSAVYSHTARVERGATLSSLLTDAGVNLTDANAAVAALRKVFDPRALKTGQEVDLTFELATNGLDPDRMLGLSFLVDNRHEITLMRDNESEFTASKEERNLDARETLITGTINASLFESAFAAGVPVPVLMAMIRSFSWDVDFQRDIHPGDSFEVLFEGFYDGDGSFIHGGKVSFASMVLSGKRIPLYFFTNQDGETDYYDAQGQSVRKALLRTPVDGARISSGFGRRSHPILGYTLMHKGVDFAVPEGTPIFAAGNGTVEMAGRNGAFGNYVRLRHNDSYATAYGHMSRIAPGMAPGKKVKQGTIIGYVGATGRATGPHLHFEVLKDMAQVNPISVKFQSGDKLAGSELATFNKTRAAVDGRYAALKSQQLAQSKN
jgi:murein DD-endopeptidase MepM/ murein hydrolase activator NlpD